MKICRKCFMKNNIVKETVDTILIASDKQEFDVCDICREEIVKILNDFEKPKKVGRPKKKGA